MRRPRTSRSVAALALAAAAAGTLLTASPAQAGDDLDSCINAVGSRTSPNGYWTIPARNFSYGSSGVCVKEIQADVSSVIGVEEADWPNFIDGQWGPKTDKYVRRFQSYVGLSADGVVGPQTWQALVSRTTD